jgi:hypothetical protein
LTEAAAAEADAAVKSASDTRTARRMSARAGVRRGRGASAGIS